MAVAAIYCAVSWITFSCVQSGNSCLVAAHYLIDAIPKYQHLYVMANYLHMSPGPRVKDYFDDLGILLTTGFNIKEGAH